MDEIMSIATARDIAVIEDACQAHGASYQGRPVGSFGAIACYSFYPSKNLGSAGEGGIAVTSAPELAMRMRRLRDHGQSSRYHHDVLGYNYRLPAIQAAVLRAKLPYLAEWNERRRAIAAEYDALLGGLDLVLPWERPGARSVAYAYVVRARARDQLAAHLQARGIATGIHYPLPVHLQPPYRRFGGGEGSLSHTETAAREVLSLPIYPELTREQIERVAEGVGSFFDGGTRVES
jgi:dTDP-4-amino-4,6-dideoxygalactose transaminase